MGGSCSFFFLNISGCVDHYNLTFLFIIFSSTNQMQTDYNSLLNELSVPGWNEFFMIATLYMFYCLYCTHVYRVRVRVRFMVFNATINDISVISWRSDL